MSDLLPKCIVCGDPLPTPIGEYCQQCLEYKKLKEEAEKFAKRKKHFGKIS